MQKIELSEDNLTKRFIAAALFLVIGGAALAYGFLQLMTVDSGWQAIQASASAGPTCAGEFVFLYELGAGGDPTVENKLITTLYTDACRKAFQLFHTAERYDDVVSLAEISARPNEVLTVDPVLYGAFEAAARFEDRTVYLGPVYARYGDLFFCTDDAQLADFDPRLSQEVREEYAAVAAYAMDPRHVNVELLGEDQICLRVSEDYLTYAQREGIDRFLDFGWLKNAFIIDYLADTMAESGCTNGAITSYDGFTRCLDGRAGNYSLNLYDPGEDGAVQVGTMEYQGPMSLLSLRTFPVGELDGQRCYRLKNGEVRTLYLDPADGMCRSAADSVTCYAPDCSCAQLALEMGPVFIADTLDQGHIEALADAGVQTAVCRGGQIDATDPELIVSGLRQGWTLEKP